MECSSLTTCESSWQTKPPGATTGQPRHVRGVERAPPGTAGGPSPSQAAHGDREGDEEGLFHDGLLDFLRRLARGIPDRVGEWLKSSRGGLTVGIVASFGAFFCPMPPSVQPVREKVPANV
jgi:hypothetical protein